LCCDSVDFLTLGIGASRNSSVTGTTISGSLLCFFDYETTGSHVALS
jgi:hypothetical protein